MKVFLLFSLIAFSSVFSLAQNIHHQMIASQGASVHVSNGFLVQQSVGQQSAIGNYMAPTFSVGQGFQQGRILKSKGPSELNIQIIAFPNPFTSKINFQFSVAIDGPIKITIYDVMGKLVMTTEKEMLNKAISLENLNFPLGKYIFKLSAKNFNYTTHLLKM